MLFTLTVIGGFNLNEVSLSQSKSENQECLRILSAPPQRTPKRFVGFARRSDLINSFASWEKYRGNFRRHLIIFLYVSIGSSSKKGGKEASISYIKIPRVHQSTPHSKHKRLTKHQQPEDSN